MISTGTVAEEMKSPRSVAEVSTAASSPTVGTLVPSPTKMKSKSIAFADEVVYRDEVAEEMESPSVAAKVSQSLKKAKRDLDCSGKFPIIPAIKELFKKVNESYSIWYVGKDTESYYNEQFETKAFEIFDDCDYNRDGVLTGKELHDAIWRLLGRSSEIRTKGKHTER